MNAIRNTKLCWNCDGEVNLEASQCPYCGIELAPIERPSAEHFRSDTGAEEYRPPYDAEGNITPSSEDRIPEPAYIPSQEEEAFFEDEEWDGVLKESEKPLEATESVSVPLTVFQLSLGALSTLFAILMLAFSHKGSLTLSWDSSYWPLFLLVGSTASYFGWQSLARIND